MTYRNLDQRNYRVYDEHFALVPKKGVPRATFRRTKEHKFTCPAGYLVPILVDEILPGDVHSGQVTIFARLGTLIFPIMDTLNVDTQFFFVPARLLWNHWKNFQGEQVNPGDSISYTIPQVVWTGVADPMVTAQNQIADYMGIPLSNFFGATVSVNALPFRAYNLIYNEWYRDQNLQNSVSAPIGDGPDLYTLYTLLRRNKRHDYFTSCLPAPQKGNAVTLPLGTTAPIIGLGVDPLTGGHAGPHIVTETGGGNTYQNYYNTGVDTLWIRAAAAGLPSNPQIYADLSQATAANINALRLAVQTQKLLESDARGGTRYTEILRARWGVTPQDARLQRPEYIGGGTTPIQTAAIAQTSQTSGSNAQGQLAGQAVGTGQHHFTCVGYEHGYVIGLLSVMSKPTYQQGLHRMWTRLTRYDFAMPEFAALGEQAVRVDEIYVQGLSTDTTTFGYQERYAEYRFLNNTTAGYFRSTNNLAIDQWHLAQKFATVPTLGDTFIQETPPMARILAAGDTPSNAMEVLVDTLFNIRSTRPLPAYGIPGGLPGTF